VRSEPYRIGDVVQAGPQSYKLVRRLGDGTFGTVYEALDLMLKRNVAIKLLRAELGYDFASRMRSEWETLARLRHPNIVQVLSAGFTTDRDVPFLTMPLLAGAPLRSLLEQGGGLPIDRALDLGVELFSALGEARRPVGEEHRRLAARLMTTGPKRRSPAGRPRVQPRCIGWRGGTAAER
jgi:serine/threonine protein kinase